MYINGWGVIKDNEKGLSLIKSAANKECVEAQETLGDYYTAINYNSAIYWYGKAAENGSEKAKTKKKKLEKDNKGIHHLVAPGSPK